MTDAFSSYEQEFLQIRSSIQSKLDKDCKEQKGEQRKATLRRITMEVEEAEEIIEQMEIAGKGKAKCMIKARTFKMEITKWKSDVKTIGATSDRAELLSNPNHSVYQMDVDDPPDFSTASQRTRLLASSTTLGTTSNRLDNAHRTALETEDIGEGIMGSLRGQREQLEGTRDMLGEADSSIGKATGTLKRMIRKMYQTRIITGMIIAVLIGLIGLVLYSKFS